MDTEMKIFLLGDSNGNLLLYDTCNNVFKHLLEQLSVINAVEEPTHFTPDTGTCIDLLLTNDTMSMQMNLYVVFTQLLRKKFHFKTY